MQSIYKAFHIIPRKMRGLVAFCFLMGSVSYALAAEEAPDQLKAAYLYNFAKLTYWPESVLNSKSTPLVICTSASDRFTQKLKDISGKPVAGHSVQVVALDIKSSSDFCHMVFVDKKHSQAWFENNKSTHKGQLLVGEMPGFIHQGGVINFFVDSGKLKFEVSINNAEKNGVQISSRLLRLAKIVEGKQ